MSVRRLLQSRRVILNALPRQSTFISIRTIVSSAGAIHPDSEPYSEAPYTPNTVLSTTPRLDALRSETKPFSSFLTDTFGRQHNYLRISLTERCNLRCLYCMPPDGISLSPAQHLLTTPEILHIARLFVKQGVTKIRLTGGEPTVRRDLGEIVEELGKMRDIGLKEICMTSNGITLARKLEALKNGGLTGLNLSLDTLDEHLFTVMTRRKGFDKVMATIDRALELNIHPLKVNVVVMSNLNAHEIPDFVALTKDKPIEVRFIEYMPFSGNAWSEGKMISYAAMLDTIRTHYPDVYKIQDGKNETSKTWHVPGHKGRIGFITSMTHNFCGSCNRLRITNDGNLKVCLFGNDEVSLRDMVRLPGGMEEGGAGERELLRVIGKAVGKKEEKHAGIGDLENMPNRPMILIDERSRGSWMFGGSKVPWRQVPTTVLLSSTGYTSLRTFSTYRGDPEAPWNQKDWLSPDDVSALKEQILSRQNTTQKTQQALHVPESAQTNKLAQHEKGEELPNYIKPSKWPKSVESFLVTDSEDTSEPSDLAKALDANKINATNATEALEALSMPGPSSPTIAGEPSGLKDSERAPKSSALFGAFNLPSTSTTTAQTDQPSSIFTIDSLASLSRSLRNQAASLAGPTAVASPDASKTRQRRKRVLMEWPDVSTNLVGHIPLGGPISLESRTSDGKPEGKLTHVNSKGEAHMVNIQSKPITSRLAIATGCVYFSSANTHNLIHTNSIAKGDVLATARIAGIMAAKRTSDLIPLCHPISLTSVELRLKLVDRSLRERNIRWHVRITATAECEGKTGVEMEALTAVSAAGLTVYDMCKAVDKQMVIGNIKVITKKGGKSGDWRMERGQWVRMKETERDGVEEMQDSSEDERDGSAEGQV